ncbi:MAG: cytochrome b N-terminal domain-containing protein, partial [Rhodospirillales bacterium]|nr:cytochrome b N-terminal domain-containing protein [Rhodospirillales bacterium]
MLNAFKRTLLVAYLWVESLFDYIFGQKYNPFYYLGALTWFFFWVVSVSGIYLFLGGFDTGVTEVYDSVQWLTHDNWYLGGIMRSLHRYGSDAMVLTTVAHLLREFCMDRYHGVRWFAWFTGVPLIWLLITSGITGYWLVWDELAQYLAIASFEWLDAIGIFSEPIANNFLRDGSLTDRFFTLLIFMHIFVPLFLLFTMWVHLMRMAHAETNPPRQVALGAFGFLIVLSLVFPAVSHGPADLGKVVMNVGLDWFYLAGYPIYDMWGGEVLWIVAVGTSFALAMVPFIVPKEKYIPAVVDLPNCNGCTRCFVDCPFGAVTMQPRTDGSRYEEEAIVKENFCTGCGICVGSCPASSPFRRSEDLVTGIDLPHLRLSDLRTRMTEEAGRLSGETKVLVFGCEHGVDLKALESPEVGTVTFTCIGQMP